jgi:hypothetical protein
MLLGWWLEFFKVQKRGQLEILQRVQGGRSQNRLERLRKLVVLLEFGVQELKEIISKCAEAAPQWAACFHIQAKGGRCRLLCWFSVAGMTWLSAR